jgi:hypothetical protein
MPTPTPVSSLRILIEKANTDLFASMITDQRPYLAEAWGNFRRSAALLAEAEHGEIPHDLLLESLARAYAGIQALLLLTSSHSIRQPG